MQDMNVDCDWRITVADKLDAEICGYGFLSR